MITHEIKITGSGQMPVSYPDENTVEATDRLGHVEVRFDETATRLKRELVLTHADQCQIRSHPKYRLAPLTDRAKI